MIDPSLVGIAASIVAAIATVGVALIGYIGTRGKNQSDQRTALERRVDERVTALMDADKERIAKLEDDRDDLEDVVKTQGAEITSLAEEVTSWRRRWGAVGRVFRALASQWPDTHMPNLDPLDIAELEDTIPPQWIRRGQ